MFIDDTHRFFTLGRSLPLIASTCLGVLLLIAAAKSANAQRTWVEQGPGPNTQGQVEGISQRPVVGAIKTVVTHPTNVDTIYVGAVNGGIWKTTNATAATPAWTAQLGLNQSLSIGAIAFDPTDATNQTLIAGAGRFSSLGSLGNDRVGVWRTTNGGTNWTLISGAGGTVTGLNVTGVAPRGATLVVSADNTGVNPGVWRSTNTGGAWTQISGLAGTGLPAGASFDLASDPSNNARLFTNSGNGGIFRSNDTGATWAKVSDAAMDAVMAAGTRNVKISVGASNNVYVAIVSNTGRLAGLFRSGDGGGTWTALDLPTTTEDGVVVGIHPGNQGGTHLSIAADLSNVNVVYIGGDRQPFRTEFTTRLPPIFPNSIGANDFSGRLYRVNASLAAGSMAIHITHSNTSGGSSPHADSRDMAIDAAGNLIETDDGGIYKRTTPLVNTGDWSALIGNLRIAEFHSIGWDSNSKIAVAGAQDTGSPHGTTPANLLWLSVSTGDGGDLAINDTGTPGISVRYSSSQELRGFRRRTYDTSNTFMSQVLPALTVVGGGAALAAPPGSGYLPFEVNNVSPTRIVIGATNSVYESMNQGDTITEIGPGIVANRTARHPIAYGATGNADMLYVGSANRVFVRTAAPPAVLTQSASYPGTGQVLGVTINNTDPQNAFVVDATNVFRTGNAGTNWTNVTGNLLTLTPGTIRSVAFSTSNAAGAVIVGTDNGVFAADGPAFTTWAALGLGLPRAPVHDLEYDPVDKILIAGLMGRGAWTINLEERTPVDVAMVLDLSGSMLSPACSTCSPKLDVLKDSVELFVQLWTLFTVPNDRIGVNYFRTNVNEFTIGPDVLVPVEANAGAIVTDVRGQTTVPANLTAMGGGIQKAISRLTDAARPRNIIVFTDGMQNVNPMVNTSTYVIADEPGRPASGVPATMPPTDLNTALGIKVNTIGVGATPPFVDLLNQIANETNGRFKLTTAPDEDLRRFYVEELIDVLRTFSPQLVGYRYGTMAGRTGSESFKTNQTARRVVLKLSWKRGTTMSFAVEKDGVDVSQFGRFINGPFYRIFSIDVPAASAPAITAAGNWTMRITGPDKTAYEAAAIVEEKNLKYEFNIGSSAKLVGDPLPLQVKLTFDGLPVTDANVSAQVLSPREPLSNLLSNRATPATPAGFQYEPSATAAQRKFQLLLGDNSFRDAIKPLSSPITFQNNGNGTYSATFNNTSLSGPYTIIYRVEGQRADIGNYSRTESQTIALTFGVPSASGSNIRAVGDRGSSQYNLLVRPVDRLGNFLGPDYGHAIVVTVNGVRVSSAPQDRLDGSYLFPIVATTPPLLTNVTITVLGRPLFSGPLSTITGPGPSTNKFAFSFHTGVAIPVKGFGSSATAGLLTEFDFEYRVTPRFSLEGVLGRYDFGTPGEIYSGSLLFKGYFPVSGGRFYVSGGPGAFHLTGGNTHFGLSGAAGFNKPITSWLELDFGASYSHIFRSNATDLGFVGVRGGVKFTF
ncbi:MAG TPA: VWA domain-containing protein [Pyrinomonadaceae bacterium]|nr:VWA domain-containing protein [Pyrinomonadaceae bacterium]